MTRLHTNRSLVLNAAWSLAGHVIPLSVAIISVPLLIHALGNEKFGILTLCWVVAGYFNILDLGLGRSLILAFSRLDKEKDRDAVSRTFWAGSSLLGGIGILTGSALYLASSTLPALLGVSVDLRDEAAGAFQLVALSLPATLLLPGLSAMPIAWQHQKSLSLIRIPSGILSHLVPIIMLPWTTDLRHLLLANLVLRICILCAHAALCWHLAHVGKATDVKTSIGSLLADGSWMMLTNIFAPLLMSMDRFVLSHTSGPSLLASYAPPLDLATKAWTLAGVGLAVMFPAMGHFLSSSKEDANRLYRNTLRILIIWTPPLLMCMAGVGRVAIEYWIGAEYSRTGGILMAIFSLGIFWALPGGVAFSAVQASGNSQRAAIIHLVEFPVYLLLLWAAASLSGVFGIACLWSLRHAMDTLLMYHSARQLSGLEAKRVRSLLSIAACASILLIAITLMHAESKWHGLIFSLFFGVLWGILAWKYDSATAQIIKDKLP